MQKTLIGWCDDIRPFRRHYYADGKFRPRHKADLPVTPTILKNDLDTALQIREKLIAGVDADAPVGLASGGLDSSWSAPKSSSGQVRTIGMGPTPSTSVRACQTAECPSSEHHGIIINRDMVINSLEEVIRLLATWDTTNPCCMGMYLLCKWIHENTDLRVILTGEISDELFGYKYTDFALSAEEFQRRRKNASGSCTCMMCCAPTAASASTRSEPAVPFGRPPNFVKYVMSVTRS